MDSNNGGYHGNTTGVPTAPNITLGPSTPASVCCQCHQRSQYSPWIMAAFVVCVAIGVMLTQVCSVNTDDRCIKLAKDLETVMTHTVAIQRQLELVVSDTQAVKKDIESLVVNNKKLDSMDKNVKKTVSQLVVHSAETQKDLTQLISDNRAMKEKLGELANNEETIKTCIDTMSAKTSDTLSHLKKTETKLVEKINALHESIQEIQSQKTEASKNSLRSPLAMSVSPRDCQDVYKDGHTKSGVYKIEAYKDATGPVYLDVFCDMDTFGGAWLVIQRRKDGSVDFNKNWKNYENGFGSLTGEFWLGNKYLHLLTNQRTWELQVDLKALSGETRYAKYSHFHVDSESNLYKLTVSGYTGTAGDSLKRHSNRKFSTWDNDNDLHRIGSGWWFGDRLYANLNGQFSQEKKRYRGVAWLGWNITSLKSAEMKIRPVKELTQT